MYFGFWFIFPLYHVVTGCEVEQFDLKVEAVNTHRDRTLVSGPLYLCIMLLCSVSCNFSVPFHYIPFEGKGLWTSA